MQADILIKNAQVVNADKQFKTNVLISEGRIKHFIADDEIEAESALKTIDAEGKYVFPGFIDPHVHFHLPTPAGFSSDDFNSGTKAALQGGTTTVMDFVTPEKGELLTVALDKRINEAELANCNYRLHVSPIDFNENTESEIIACIERGIRSFKVYMAYKEAIGLGDEELRKVMQVLAKYDKVLLVHAEDGDRIEELRCRFADEGRTAPKYHPESRPPETEADAVKKLLDMAEETGCKVYIVHVSAAESLKHIRKAEKKGLKVFAETCPHYLLLDDSRYEGNFEDASAYVLSPPLRSAGNEEELWKALADGVFDTIGTDHCPFTKAQKAKGISDFRKIPNGAGGVEFRPALLYTYGVEQNRISLEQFVKLLSAGPAKIFGLYPQKGMIAEGSDADLVIWNPAKRNTVSSRTHFQNTDINIYEGFKTKGESEIVILGGEIVKS
jgi:dihydropyrimidinase